jgi:uncharacterized protein (DUF486 family)
MEKPGLARFFDCKNIPIEHCTAYGFALICLECVYDVCLVLHINQKDLALWKAILMSWGIALAEYCLTVPANRWGYTHGSLAFS